MELTPVELEIHKRAVETCETFRKSGIAVIEILIEVDAHQLYKKFERASLYQYAINELGLVEEVAYSFMSVARRAAKIKELRSALQSHELSVYKAQRFVSVLNDKNAAEWIAFAKKNSCKKINQRVSQENPTLRRGNPFKDLSAELQDKIERVHAIECQKAQAHISREEALERALDFYLKRQDPVIKARRVIMKKAPSKAESGELCTSTVQTKIRKRKRVALTAQQLHTIRVRDEGRCTHVTPDGQRCQNDRWLSIHHVTPVCDGGSNDPENLVTLCSAHHRLAHETASQPNAITTPH